MKRLALVLILASLAGAGCATAPASTPLVPPPAGVTYCAGSCGHPDTAVAVSVPPGETPYGNGQGATSTSSVPETPATSPATPTPEGPRPPCPSNTSGGGSPAYSTTRAEPPRGSGAHAQPSSPRNSSGERITRLQP